MRFTLESYNRTFAASSGGRAIKQTVVDLVNQAVLDSYCLFQRRHLVGQRSRELQQSAQHKVVVLEPLLDDRVALDAVSDDLGKLVGIERVAVESESV